MFSSWLFVRIRAAERALDQGRLDEAYRMALEPDLREHKRGQHLLEAVARPLLARARLHTQSGRHREALDDLERLRAIGQASPDAEALRLRLLDELRARHERNAQNQEATAQAERDLKDGRLDSVRASLERVEDEQRREQLRNELDIRVQRSAQVLEQVRKALDDGDTLTACRLWEETGARHGHSRESDAFAARIAAALRALLTEHLHAGRLTEMQATLRRAAALRRFEPAIEQLERLGALAEQAAAALAHGDFVAIRALLLRLSASCGSAAWVSAALNAVGRIATEHELLLQSPLGALAGPFDKTRPFVTDMAARMRDDAGVQTENLIHHAPQSRADEPGAALNGGPLLLLIDAAGSALLLARDTVRIGRAGGGAAVDVPLPAEVQSHHADIVRAGEDYFLVAYGPARVNQREVRRALLRDGDRIALGSGAKLTFAKPSSKSDSAVLLISDRCRPAGDVSKVILFKDTCLIGPQASCHVRTREGENRLVLFERDSRLHVRRCAADGRPIDSAEAVVLGQTQSYGDQRMTVTEYGADGGRGNV